MARVKKDAIKYGPRLAKRLCDAIAGGETVNKICNKAWAPTRPTFYAWLMKYEDFFNKYTRAREIQSHAFMDDLPEISDDLTDEAHSRRVRIDARRIFAEKCYPRKYGAKQQIEHSGEQKLSINIIDRFGGDDGNNDSA